MDFLIQKEKFISKKDNGFAIPQILILGIGDDGHIASIFKNSKIFSQATNKNARKRILKSENKIVATASGVWKILTTKPSKLGSGG